MARSKEQWKAQQKRAMHTQSQSNSFFQVKRPSPHPSASSALFQLGKPAPAALLKPDPIQIPRQSGSSSSQVIDLTLDDEEEEDEPMGAQVTQQPATPAGADAVSAAAFDALQLRMLDGTENEASAVAQSLQTDSISEMLVPLAEDVESDVDEEWPKVPPVETPSVTSVVTASVPLSVNKQPSHGQTTEEVGVALDAIRRTIPFSQGGQQRNDAEKTDQVEVNDQQTHTLSYDDDDNKMEADVDEELPIQASTAVGDASGSKTADRVVRVENLEDGEIFEEGAAPKASVQVQRVIMREHDPDQFDALPVDAMGIRPHLRNKKQKKRGKKKTKRKLEAMQLMHGSPGEMPTEFERVIRQRPFVDTPPPGQYTLAMMRNGPTRGEPMNVRPVFQDPPPAPFRPVFVGGPHPPTRRPPPQLPTPPLPPYEDSQILRVNRQGGMEMLDGEAELLPRPMLSDLRYGGFKYRSVSMSPPRPVSVGLIHNLQRAVSSDQSHLPPFPTSSHDGTPNPVANKKTSDSDDFDLDSLRAAALRSKIKRPPKPSTAAIQKASLSLSEPSSPRPSPLPFASGQRSSKPTSPEIDKLRLEILRSMTRNRKRGANKAHSTMVPLTLPANEEKSVETPEQNDRAKPSGGDEGDNATCDPQAAPGDSSVPRNLPATAQAKAFGDMIEGAMNDGSSCETDKSTATSEQNEVGDKMDPPSASTLESPKPSAKVIATTPEFRPLTACSQSLVIRLNPEDFSPRKVGNDTHAVSSKATASSSVQEAIKKLRLEIAEREKTKTNRLLENAAAKLSKQSSGTGASSAASSSSSPDQLSPERDIKAISAQPPDATATSPKVYATDICTGEGRLSGRVAGEAEGKGSTDGVYTSAEVTERNVAEALPPEARTPAETVTGQEASSAPVESLREPVLEPQEQSDTSGGISEDVPATRSCLTTEQTASRDASKPASRKSELDFDAIRAEYEQCVTECEEADMHIAQLSDEMAQLQKLSVGSTASGS